MRVPSALRARAECWSSENSVKFERPNGVSEAYKRLMPSLSRAIKSYYRRSAERMSYIRKKHTGNRKSSVACVFFDEGIQCIVRYRFRYKSLNQCFVSAV